MTAMNLEEANEHYNDVLRWLIETWDHVGRHYDVCSDLSKLRHRLESAGLLERQNRTSAVRKMEEEQT